MAGITVLLFSVGMMDKKKKKQTVPEHVQVRCPKCGYTEIILLPVENLPFCPKDTCKGVSMLIEELLDEGKSY